MMLSGSWTMADLEENYQEIDYGILPYPVSDATGELVSPTGSWQLAMTEKTEKRMLLRPLLSLQPVQNLVVL